MSTEMILQYLATALIVALAVAFFVRRHMRARRRRRLGKPGDACCGCSAASLCAGREDAARRPCKCPPPDKP